MLIGSATPRVRARSFICRRSSAAFSVTNLASALKDFEGTGLGVSYYLNKHVHKIQADWFSYEDKVTGAGLDEFRVQLQVIF